MAICVLALGLLQTHSNGQSKSVEELRVEVRENLNTHILKPWFPSSVDLQGGGFFESFNNEWKPTGNEHIRSIVYQSRLTWVAASMVNNKDTGVSDDQMFRKACRHGISALKSLMWDMGQGGFFWQVKIDQVGHATPTTFDKHAYGNSFGIYASASAYGATKDPQALKLALDGFHWLDKHAHDNINGGYYEALTRAGKPIITRSGNGRDNIGTKFGYKSMNSHIHLLEAFTELYKVHPNREVRVRLLELFKIVRDKVYVDPGCLHLYFNPNWRPIPDGDSFGHDIETAYLLVDAAEVLGMQRDAATWRAAKNLVDHALEVGWDTKNGGFYDYGTAFGPASKLEKVWWTQAEGLNALLLIHLHNGGSTSKYWRAFLQQWNFIQMYQVDNKFGGWYSTVSPELVAQADQNKSDQWKDPYHQGRALMNVLRMLKSLNKGDTNE